jgi:release factor glutamine methyltransferase
VTIAALLERGSALLGRASESPRADALLLLAHVVRRNRAWLVAHGERSASPSQCEAFLRLCDRRSGGTPVAYLLGTAGFYGRDFVVDERVLVPRPETEHLVEEALRFVGRFTRALDVGTGCGAIACTIAAESKATVDATDVSPGAIEVAKTNAGRLNVRDRCTFYVGDLVEPVRQNRYDVILANLPYIPTKDLPAPPEAASFEPHIALNGGPDGLSLYRRLVPALAQIIDEEGLILLEAAAPNINELKELCCQALPTFAISVVNDYASLPRYVKAVRSRS